MRYRYSRTPPPTNAAMRDGYALPGGGTVHAARLGTTWRVAHIDTAGLITYRPGDYSTATAADQTARHYARTQWHRSTT